ncbi:hypothetical protein VCRA2119O147_340011 [Vibrio crassostreae]|nr:hypothetical protein VCRA2119O147_340011 [Vibrio crassostreae]CAK2809722.1 hypothetical protein VCRA2110O183_310011 [Vibrio crassostreae]CAK2893774.1 hypothetical protein VCRA2121O264_310011 [Vibrio crassostreae]CAK3567704.1 hypothetical protein VCRA2121O262_320055 [Vibrio crassostreae]
MQHTFWYLESISMKLNFESGVLDGLYFSRVKLSYEKSPNG